MKQYLDLVRRILEDGEIKGDRTGTGTQSIFGEQLRFDLREGFPLLTTKKVLFESLARELIWFIQGKTNINDGLVPFTKIWNPWADDDGNLGPIYGYQWRFWEKFTYDEDSKTYKKEHVDQLKEAINLIKNNPDSRRIIVNAWNVGDLDRMALPPCHMFYQFYVAGDHLDLQLYQRSADVALGVPFNIASYALLLMMVAQECGLKPRYFIHTFGDAHIYLDHKENILTQLERSPLPLSQVTLENKGIFDMTIDDIKLNNYEHHAFIKFPISV